MSLAGLIALTLGLSLTAYAVFAGADFGAGILHLLAGKAARTRNGEAGSEGDDRAAIAEAVGPLWEANHVWLIFSITILFSAFPSAFSALGTSLLAPFTIALLAIVLRSVALGLRSSPEARERSQVRLGWLFGIASLIAPFAFGTVAGGLAKASVAAQAPGTRGPAIPWTSPFALIVGALAVALCAQLAASFVALRLARCERDRAAERFRRRALQASACVLLLMVLALVAAATTAPAVWHRLTGPTLPSVIVGLAVETFLLLALARRRYLVARTASVLSGVALLWGWFAAQAPHLIGPRLTVYTAAATRPALAAIAIAGGVVLLLVLPAMYLLFTVFARPVPEVVK
jgi:cytochrome bd ubiquinol oxidase subunit II